MGQKDDGKLRACSFIRTVIRGLRPRVATTADGKLSLVDGVFMEAIKAASKDPTSRFVVVIEEINRGNPAQVFGELLTLLEAGKRTPAKLWNFAIRCGWRTTPGHIPENLYVIGTMNIADRSLALVDLALRRRFAFVGLEPQLSGKWREWVVRECGIDASLVADIQTSNRGIE